MRNEIHEIPHALTLNTTDTPYTNPSGMNADYDLGGIYFLSAASDEIPYQRQLAKIRKDQFDSSANPGDNSLQGWWLRSQTDWSMGAGQPYMEPIATENVDRFYASSAGVDVFSVPGEATLLPAMGTAAQTMTNANPGFLLKVPNGYIYAAGTTVTRYVSGVSNSVTAAGTVTSMIIAGPNLLVASNGKIEWAPVVGTFALTTGFTMTAIIPRMWWVKGRTLIALGNKIHQNSGSTITGSTDLVAATPLYTLQDSTSVVVGAATTPKSILLAINTTSGSSIQALTLDTAGALPTTTAPIVVAEFPSAESLLDLASYLGTYVGIATSFGVRIGTIDGNGNLTYGPLLNSPLPSKTQDVFSAFDRFLHYATANAGDSIPGIVRIDLSELQKDGRAPWANWLRTSASTAVNGCIVTGLRTALVWAQNGSAHSLYDVKDANGLADGWLETSAVRFGTLEAKSFDSVRLLMNSPMQGSVFLSVINSEGSESGIGTMTSAMGYEATFRTANRKSMTSMSLRFAMSPESGTPTLGPTLQAWTMKAYPSVESRGESVLLPLLNFDFEKDSHGVPWGYTGRAWDRWQALRDRLTDGTSLVVKEFQSGGSYVAMPEDASFTQSAPPSSASGFGGIISVVLKTI